MKSDTRELPESQGKSLTNKALAEYTHTHSGAHTFQRRAIIGLLIDSEKDP